MSSARKKLHLNSVAVDIGCSSCRRSKLSNIFHPKSKRNYLISQSSSSTSWDKIDTTTTATATTSSTTASSQYSDTDRETKNSMTVRGLGRTGGESLAVEKDSDDPYLDFRQSMLQMILENEIYSKEDLRQLLNCFLQLNSPCHHGIIVRAFAEIWNGVFSVRSASSSKLHCKSRDF